MAKRQKRSCGDASSTRSFTLLNQTKKYWILSFLNRSFFIVFLKVDLSKLVKNLKCNSQIETMYRLHLSSAYGFYNHLILRFQSEFNSVIQLNGFLDFPFLNYEKQPLTGMI